MDLLERKIQKIHIEFEDLRRRDLIINIKNTKIQKKIHIEFSSMSFSSPQSFLF